MNQNNLINSMPSSPPPPLPPPRRQSSDNNSSSRRNKTGAKTLRGDRVHIGFFGRRNAGKSSLINTITGQEVSIVSATPGTTTDPVYKSLELAPLGPVVLIDTAGLDDNDQQLGASRISRSLRILAKTDLAVIVIDNQLTEFEFEQQLISSFEKNKIPWLIAVNKSDRKPVTEVLKWLPQRPSVKVSALNSEGIEQLKQRIIELAPKQVEPPFLSDLINPGEIVLLVVPIDLGAPRGRLIMPQIKALRDILDADGIAVMCKDRELIDALERLEVPPALVITDSQVFPQVAADVPESILLTSFSILSARQKGLLDEMVEATRGLKQLRPGDRVLICESCSHHPLEDDIGRVKIPRWLDSFVGGALDYDLLPGQEINPDNLIRQKYKLIVHCGGCTLNRRSMLNRQEIARNQSIPLTNYGVLISCLKGVFPRALKPFPRLYQRFTGSDQKTEIELRRTMARFTDI